MSELIKPELGEPSKALKQEFRSVINNAIPEGLDWVSFPLDDGRILELGITLPTEGDESSSSHNATYIETVQGEHSSSSRHATYYHVYADGEVSKSIEVKERRAPAVEAELDQIRASQRTRLQELNAMGVNDSEAKQVVLEEASKNLRKLPDGTSFNPYESLSNDLLVSKQEEELGLIRVSGIELQSVIEEIRQTTTRRPRS
jgi:hypothetical protein